MMLLRLAVAFAMFAATAFGVDRSTAERVSDSKGLVRLSPEQQRLMKAQTMRMVVLGDFTKSTNGWRAANHIKDVEVSAAGTSFTVTSNDP